MVVHTHEDVDQMFSRISVGIRNKTFQNLPDLYEGIHGFFTPSPTEEHLTNIWDYRALAVESGINLTGHSVPHLFRITEREWRVIMSTKSWALSSEGYKDIDVTDLASSFASDPLPVVPARSPKFQEANGRVMTDLTKWMSSGRLSNEGKDWWVNYLQSELKAAEEPDIHLASTLPTYARQRRHEGAIPVAVAQVLENHVQAMNATPNVALRRRRQ